MELTKDLTPFRWQLAVDERLHAWLIVNEMELSLLSNLLLATAGSQWKRIRLIKLWNTSTTLNKLNFVIPISYFLTEVSYESAETQLYRNVIFSLEFRYRPPNYFLVSSLQIAFNHSCVKYIWVSSNERRGSKLSKDVSFFNFKCD